MQTISIPAELAQAIADYLATRPYREVAGLIAALQQAAATSQAPDAEAKDAAKSA